MHNYVRKSNSEAWYAANENICTFNSLAAACFTVSIKKQEVLNFFGVSRIWFELIGVALEMLVMNVVFLQAQALREIQFPNILIV